MKISEFQAFLLKSAVYVMSCDGSIENDEIEEIRKMAKNEVFFLGYEINQPLQENIR